MKISEFKIHRASLVLAHTQSYNRTLK